jgi:hypothetical protein
MVGGSGGCAVDGSGQFVHGERMVKHLQRSGAQRAEDQCQRPVGRCLHARGRRTDRVAEVAHSRTLEADSERAAVSDHRHQGQSPSAQVHAPVAREREGQHSIGVADARVQAVQQRRHAAAHRRGPHACHLAVQQWRGCPPPRLHRRPGVERGIGQRGQPPARLLGRGLPLPRKGMAVTPGLQLVGEHVGRQVAQPVGLLGHGHVSQRRDRRAAFRDGRGAAGE